MVYIKLQLKNTQLAEKTFSINHSKVWSMALQQFTQGPVQDNIFNSDSIKACAHLQIAELISPGEAALRPLKYRADMQHCFSISK